MCGRLVCTISHAYDFICLPPIDQFNSDYFLLPNIFKPPRHHNTIIIISSSSLVTTNMIFSFTRQSNRRKLISINYGNSVIINNHTYISIPCICACIYMRIAVQLWPVRVSKVFAWAHVVCKSLIIDICVILCTHTEWGIKAGFYDVISQKLCIYSICFY